MTFFTILIALVIERAVEPLRPARRYDWFRGYCQRIAGTASLQWLIARPWGAALVVLPILAVILWLQVLTGAVGAVVAVPFGVLVLLYSIGPRDLGDDAEAYLAARDAGDAERATAVARQICLTEVQDTEPRRSFAVARAIVVLANRRLVGPLFWFVLFGPVGAAGYRLVHLLAERLQTEDCPRGMRRGSDEIRHIADWAPARLTAAGYAVAGNFDAVAHAWRTFDYLPGDGPLDESDNLLAQTGLGALDTFPDEADDLAGDAGPVGNTDLIPPVVEDALALVWRSLALWVAAIGGVSLVAALA